MRPGLKMVGNVKRPDPSRIGFANIRTANSAPVPASAIGSHAGDIQYFTIQLNPACIVKAVRKAMDEQMIITFLRYCKPGDAVFDRHDNCGIRQTAVDHKGNRLEISVEYASCQSVRFLNIRPKRL